MSMLSSRPLQCEPSARTTTPNPSYGTRPPTTSSPRSTETKPPPPTKPNPRHTTSHMMSPRSPSSPSLCRKASEHRGRPHPSGSHCGINSYVKAWLPLIVVIAAGWGRCVRDVATRPLNGGAPWRCIRLVCTFAGWLAASHVASAEFGQVFSREGVPPYAASEGREMI